MPREHTAENDNSSYQYVFENLLKLIHTLPDTVNFDASDIPLASSRFRKSSITHSWLPLLDIITILELLGVELSQTKLLT